MPDIESYVSQPMNKKRARAIMDVDDPQPSSGRRVRKLWYNNNYADEIKTCFWENGAGFEPA